MRTLAFDTATRATTVALDDGEHIAEARDDPPGDERPGHASRLLPLVAELMDGAQLAFSDLDRIAVGVGPGTFTGLRIGIATAHALGRASGVPLAGVSTLQALALNAEADAPATAGAAETVLAVLDARRGEVFTAGWDLGAALGPPRLDARALGPDALVEVLSGLSSPLAIGDGAVAFREVLEGGGAQVPEDRSALHRVTAVRHCQIARRLSVSGSERLSPDYQRPPDAKPTSPVTG